jgi:hypothetical protein
VEEEAPNYDQSAQQVIKVLSFLSFKTNAPTPLWEIITIYL